MGSRTPQPGDAVGDGRQSNGTHTQSKTVLREVQNEAHGAASPRTFKKEGHSQTAAEDSAGLKDYVGALMVLRKRICCSWSDTVLATWRLPWERRLRLGFQSVEHGNRGNRCCQTSQARRPPKERAESHHCKDGLSKICKDVVANPLPFSSKSIYSRTWMYVTDEKYSGCLYID